MIRFTDNKLSIGSLDIKLEYPIQQVFLYGDLILVLYRPESFQGLGQFQNLVAISSSGESLWKAELPTTSSMDAYYQVLPGSDLVADSYTSFRCHLNPANGKIIGKSFFK